MYIRDTKKEQNVINISKFIILKQYSIIAVCYLSLITYVTILIPGVIGLVIPLVLKQTYCLICKLSTHILTKLNKITYN